jgi:hypothetical protein
MFGAGAESRSNPAEAGNGGAAARETAVLEECDRPTVALREDRVLRLRSGLAGVVLGATVAVVVML